MCEISTARNNGLILRAKETACGGPRYGNSSSRSSCGPTLSPVTFPSVRIEKKTSTTSSVSVRQLCGYDSGWRGMLHRMPGNNYIATLSAHFDDKNNVCFYSS